MPAAQCGHVLSEYMNGAMTKSPARTVVTSGPTSSTTPTNSVPMRAPSVIGFSPRYGHRSDPQMQEAVIRTTASVGARIVGVATSDRRTSNGAGRGVAFTGGGLSLWLRGRDRADGRGGGQAEAPTKLLLGQALRGDDAAGGQVTLGASYTAMSSMPFQGATSTGTGAWPATVVAVRTLGGPTGQHRTSFPLESVTRVSGTMGAMPA